MWGIVCGAYLQHASQGRHGKRNVWEVYRVRHEQTCKCCAPKMEIPYPIGYEAGAVSSDTKKDCPFAYKKGLHLDPRAGGKRGPLGQLLEVGGSGGKIFNYCCTSDNATHSLPTLSHTHTRFTGWRFRSPVSHRASGRERVEKGPPSRRIVWIRLESA